MNKDDKTIFETIDLRLRNLEVRTSVMLAMQTVFIGIGGFLAISLFQHLTTVGIH